MARLNKSVLKYPWIFLAVITLTISVGVRSSYLRHRQLHEPPPGVPSFRRDSVESFPAPNKYDALHDRSANYDSLLEFGSKSLPLRSAVESVPRRQQFRLPLRDAVERRPAPDEPYELFDSDSEILENVAFKQTTHPFFPDSSVILPPYFQFQNLINGYAFPALQPILPYRGDSHFQQLLVSPRSARNLASSKLERGNKNYLEKQSTPSNNPAHYHLGYLHPFQQKERQQPGTPSAQRRLVCYMEGRAAYRKEPLAFTPQQIATRSCTHVIYAFASLDAHTNSIAPRDHEYDIVRGGYRAAVGLKRIDPALKVLLAIGGTREEGANRFSAMVASASRRREFILSTVDFLTQHEFDGVDLYWQYPGAEELGGNIRDKENFVLLLDELKETFKPNGWLVSVTLPASRFKLDDGFDLPNIGSIVDFVTLQAYDFNFERQPVLADHHAPLLQRDHDKGVDIFYNVDYAVRHVLKRGIPPSKLTLGIGFHGRTFTLRYTNATAPGSPIRAPGVEGFYTQQPGMLAYFEICDMLRHDELRDDGGMQWTRYRDSVGAPYIVRGDQWIGYEDKDSIRNKILYLKEVGLGGASVWAADLDDFQGLCGEKWPLIHTARETLQDGASFDSSSNVAVKPTGACFTDGLYPDPSDCGAYYLCRGGLSYHLACGESMLWDARTNRCEHQTSGASATACLPGQSVLLRSSKDSSKPKVVCYITNWAFYRKTEGKFVPEHLDQRLCTHVVYAFASLDPQSLLMKEFDPWADIDNDLYERVTSIPDVTVLLGLGGWTDSAGEKYSRLVSDEKTRRKFVDSAVSFLKRHGFHGLHFDWNYPKCWQSNCRKGPATDRPNFTKLIEELKQEFDRQSPPLSLAAALSGYKEVIDVAYDLGPLGKALDFMSVMTYDYHGSWEKETGHVSPLYQRPGDKYPQYNTNFTMEYLVNKGAPRNKLLLGIPFYGQSFTLSRRDGDYSVGARAAGPGDAGEFTKQPGMLAYYEICYRIKNQRWQTSEDTYSSSGPYAYSRGQWVGYEDPASVAEKTKYIKTNGFGGAVAWTVDLDDFSNRCCLETFPLLKTINRGLGRLSSSAPVGGDCTKPEPPVTPPAPTLTTGVDTGAMSSTTHMHDTEHSTTTMKSTTWPTWMSTSKPTEMTVSSTWWSTTSTTTKKPTTTTRKPTTTTRKPTTSRPTTTKKPTQSAPPSVTMPSMDTQDCETGMYLPDPMNCNSYYRCVLGEMKKQNCAGGLHWNKNTLVCDWPAEAKCDTNLESTQPTTTTMKPMTTTRRMTTEKTTTRRPRPTKTTTSKPSTTSKPPINECVTGQYYANDNDCESFFVCVNGILITQRCGPGLAWDAKKDQCDWNHKVRCSNAMKTDVKPPPINDAELKDRPQGPCEANAYASYPGDCKQYLMCLWGKYEAFQCAPGLVWNNERKNCDWPGAAKCEQSDSIPSVIHEADEDNTLNKPTYKPDRPVIVADESFTKPPTTTTTSKPVIVTVAPPPLSGEFKIVCYFTNWAWYRRGIGKYTPENIDPNLCTHIIYGFAVLDYENLVIKAHDSWADFDNKFYQRVVAYKAKGLKVSLAIGGWNDSAGDKYSRLVNNPAARERFIKHVLAFLEKYEFDGLDLDWEYPKCWQVACDKGPESDKAAFAAFLKELHAAFEPRGLLLSAAVSPSKTVIDAGYDVPALAAYLDWVAVMTYDFHGQWDKQTGHVAPLYYHPEDAVDFFNANFSINYWISEGVPRQKIIMGMPLYGQSFQLESTQNHELNARAPGPGQAGEFTRAAGFLAYYEICDRVKNRGWTVVQDPEHRMGPYAYKGNQWVSFDDGDMIRRKSEYIRKMKLGGGMIWALDLDDFRNRCGDGPHPLLSIIRNVLSKGSGESGSIIQTGAPNIEKPEKPEAMKPDVDKPKEPEVMKPEIEKPKEPEVMKPDKPSSEVDMPKPTEKPAHQPGTSSEKEEYKVVCYFTNWAWYRQGKGKFLPSDIDPDLCTHVVYGFAVLNGDQLVIKPHDTWADFDNKFYEKVTSLRSKGIKVLIAIGGWNDSAGDKYSKLVNNPMARRRFIAHVVDFIEANKFDGLDLDWEYPKCWQVDCNKGPESDKAAFAEFVKELRAAFTPRNWLLSAAVSPSKRVIDAGYDVPVLSENLDWIAVMAYDYHGQWDKITGHVAPMYTHPEDVDVTFNTNFTIHYWISQGADRRKIVLGMPLYGQSFSLADNNNNGLNAPTYGGGEAGEETRARGFLAYYEICENIKKKGWKVIRDSRGRMGPYAYLRDQWVSFDDVSMIEHKSNFVRAMGLGGGMVWALDLDDFRNTCNCEPYPLLRTINRVLRGYTKQEKKCSLESGPIRIQDSDSPQQVKPPAPIPGTSCDGRLFVAHENDCNAYYLCNQGELQVQRCPIGLYWNRDHCDWPENSPCHPDSTPATPSEDVDQSLAEVTTTTKPVVSTTMKPSYPGTDNTIIQDTSGYKVVCYFTNWAWYRQGDGKYTPDDIDANLCTHITYGFAVLDSTSLTIKPHDSWADIDNKFYDRVTALKAKGIKVLIALGGWNDSLGDKYSRLVNNPSARARFITNVIEFIEKWKFDGLDLDWEYPKCWQVDCNKGPDSDKAGFAAFVRELKQAFIPHGWLLSSAVSPSKAVIDAGYDVAEVSKYFDWIAVMTYDFHGHWDKQTGHVAPLYYYPGDTYDYFNANFSLNYWIEQGAPPSKLVMGMPLYGQSFSLADTNNRGLNAKSYGPGEAGEFTRAGGFLAFYEICERVKRRGWSVTRDPEGRIGPYANIGNQWVSYDDISEIRRKSKLIKDLKLAGGMIWALDLDDFRNRCGCGKHPLLKVMNHELRGLPVDVSLTDCT